MNRFSKDNQSGGIVLRTAVISRRQALIGGGLVFSGAATSGLRARTTGQVTADSSGGVTDHLVFGTQPSEQAHSVRATGPSAVTSGTVEEGQITEQYTARAVSTGGQLTARIQVKPDQRLTLQLREVRPNSEWGAQYGYQVYLNGTLAYARDPQAADPGGGPYNSVFLDTADPALIHDGTVDVTVAGASNAPAYLNEIWAYSNLPQMVDDQGMQTPDRIVFVLGQDYLGKAAYISRLNYIAANVQSSPDVGLGMGFLDYYTVRNTQQLSANYGLWLALSRQYGMPFVIHSTTDWEGTPASVPDGHGGHFGDIKYQEILWSPQQQVPPGKQIWNGQSLADVLGPDADPHYGLSVPNIWGNTPWLTWHDPDLNAYYTSKLNDSISLVRPMIWDLQRTGEQNRLLPFSTTLESTYWVRNNGDGVADQGYTAYNNGVERLDILADFNPSTVAAAKADGVDLDPVNGLSDAAKRWLYKNQSSLQQMFANLYYDGLPRERIQAGPDGVSFPTDMIRHNVHSEIYSRKQAPYWSGTFPSMAEGVLHHARPGSEYIELNDYSPGGFYHLQKAREFGRIANPNLENSVSFYPPDKTLLLRQLYVNGSRYTELYNWQMANANPPADRVENWVNPYINDLHPLDAVNDAPPTGQITGEMSAGTTFTAGDLRLANHIDVRVNRTGQAAPLRLTLYGGADKKQVVGMRYLSAAEIPATGWVSFYMPVTELNKGQTYYFDVGQVGGSPAYSYPTSGGSIGYRVGLDMPYERDRSMVIQWRRDATDAIADVSGQMTPQDGLCAEQIHAAKGALNAGQYVDAYRLAIKADSLRYPVLYQVQSGSRAQLSPFPLTAIFGSDLDVDIEAYSPGQQLSFSVSGYGTGQATFSVTGFPGSSRVGFDGTAVKVSRNGAAITFTVDLPDTNSHELRIESTS